MEKWLDASWPWILRFTGLGIAMWQMAFDNADRPYLLLLAGGMMGIPEAWKIQKAVNRNKNGK